MDIIDIRGEEELRALLRNYIHDEQEIDKCISQIFSRPSGTILNLVPILPDDCPCDLNQQYKQEAFRIFHNKDS